MMNNGISRSVRALAQADFTRIATSFSHAGFTVRLPVRGILQLASPNRFPQRARLLLSAGIHGDETAPIEMLAQLLDGLAAEPHALAVDLMVVVGNLEAIAQGRRFVDADMNRLFRGGGRLLQTCAEARRAEEIMREATSFFTEADAEKWHFDLHAAIRPSHYPSFAVVPAAIVDTRKNALLGWLGQAGIGAIILNPMATGTFSSYTAAFGAASSTLELGQVGALGENDLSRLAGVTRAIDEFIRSGRILAGDDIPPLFRVSQALIKHSDAFRMLFGRDTKNFTPLQPGTVIAEDGDRVYRVGPETEYVVFPNPDVRVGLRAGLMVVRSG